MGKGIMLIRAFILKVINDEKNFLTHHKIIDRIVEQTVSVCNESKLWIHLNYSSKFIYFCIIDIWTLKKDFC